MLSTIDDNNIVPESFYKLPAKKRLDTIIDHPTPLKLVHALPTVDVLLTIRELGGESSLELMEMLSKTQVQELFDLETWSQDRLNAKAAGHYFSLLFEANRDSAIAQIHGLDIELLGLMLKTVAEIYEVHTDGEPYDLTELYSVTPGGRFIICFNNQGEQAGLAQALYTLLEELYARDLPFVLRLLERVRYELPSMLEEESLRFRDNRMLDLGIVPRVERLKYFAPVSPAEIKELLRKNQERAVHLTQNTLPLRSLPLTIQDCYPFLQQALNTASLSAQEEFGRAFMHAAINMHASLSEDFGDREELSKTTEYVKYLLELGLCQACMGEREQAHEVLFKAPLAYLIRLGRTTLIGLRKRLIKRMTDSNFIFGQGFCHLDAPLREVAQALILPEPRYYEGLLDPKKVTVRFFATLAELSATVNAVNEILFRAELLGPPCLGLNHDQLVSHTKLSQGQLFARILVNNFLDKEPLTDLVPADLKNLFGDDKKLTKPFTNFAQQFAQATAQRYASHTEISYEEALDKTTKFLTYILIQLEQQGVAAISL